MDKQDEWEWIVTGHDPARGRRIRAGERRARAHRRRLVRGLTVVMVVCTLLGVFVFAWIMVERHEAGVEQARAAAMAVQTDPARDLSGQGDAYNRALASKPQVIGETLSQDGVSGDLLVRLRHGVLGCGGLWRRGHGPVADPPTSMWTCPSGMGLTRPRWTVAWAICMAPACPWADKARR
mgnify:CR=1 FL=1